MALKYIYLSAQTEKKLGTTSTWYLLDMYTRAEVELQIKEP